MSRSARSACLLLAHEGFSGPCASLGWAEECPPKCVYSAPQNMPFFGDRKFADVSKVSGLLRSGDFSGLPRDQSNYDESLKPENFLWLESERCSRRDDKCGQDLVFWMQGPHLWMQREATGRSGWAQPTATRKQNLSSTRNWSPLTPEEAWKLPEPLMIGQPATP